MFQFHVVAYYIKWVKTAWQTVDFLPTQNYFRSKNADFAGKSPYGNPDYFFFNKGSRKKNRSFLVVFCSQTKIKHILFKGIFLGGGLISLVMEIQNDF